MTEALKTLRIAIQAVQEKGEKIVKEGNNLQRQQQGKNYQDIAQKLLDAFQIYITTPTQTNEQFSNTCHHILFQDPNVQSIRHNRIWKPLLDVILNALVCVTGIGAIVQIAYYALNKRLLFKAPTEREEKLKIVRDAIDLHILM